MREWAFEHWILTFILVLLLGSGIISLISRMFSVLNVAFRGWPPTHLDADGDWKPTEEKENG